VGLQKTGTKTIGDALRVLGHRVASWSGDSANFTLRWHEKAFTPEMAKTVAGHDAFEDWPWPLLFEKLDHLEPNARFVLTIRKDPETWLRSVQAHIARHSRWVGHYLIYGSYDPVADADKFLGFYERHNRSVRAYFRDRPGKLLEMCFETGDGWPELCGFLGVSQTPTVPFPHANKTIVDIEEQSRRYQQRLK